MLDWWPTLVGAPPRHIEAPDIEAAVGPRVLRLFERPAPSGSRHKPYLRATPTVARVYVAGRRSAC